MYYELSVLPAQLSRLLPGGNFFSASGFYP